VCYVHCYRDPGFIRKEAQLSALRRMPEVELQLACNRHRGLRRYAETIQALWVAKRSFHADVFVLGFRSHEIYWLVKLVARDTPVVFDALMSPSCALVEERKAGWLGVVLGKLLMPLEARILRNADLVLTDTAAHAGLYMRRFGVGAERIVPLPVGAREVASGKAPDADAHRRPLRVLFYGSFLPLHGVDMIVDAAALLQELELHFVFIGGSRRDERWLRRRCDELGIRHYTYRRWVSYDALLRDEIAKADVCLGGPFGDTPQARRVITTKTSQCLARGRPTIVGATEVDDGFIDRVNCLRVEQRNAPALAAALRWCHDHRDQLTAIGEHGARLYHERLSIEAIVAPLNLALRRLLERRDR
jgi:glycosyltransferase involved in cell wall biosynthesis